MCNPPGATNVTIEITAELSVCVGCDATAEVRAYGQLGSTPITVMLTETNNGTGDIDLSTNSLSLTSANGYSTNFTVTGVTASSSIPDTFVVATVTGEGGTNCVAEMDVTCRGPVLYRPCL